MKNITVHANQMTGKIKQLHGVGGGPVSDNFVFDARKEFKEAGFPYCRLHDIEHPYGKGEFVDIHCIFPDFSKDVEDPAAYNFTFTDEYLKYILETGAEPFYRLGASIEHQPIKRFIHPPENFEKWGKICSHIVAHYNEGWANGYHMGITYWEFLNEPELKDQCFTGTDEQVLELYETAARILKAEHPDIKVGGIANCTPYAPLAEKFLAHVKETGAPLDFFSWHGYSRSPEESADFAEYAAKLLKKYGFENVESIYDEWNYVMAWDETIPHSIEHHRDSFGAAYVAGVLTALQKTPLDKSMYYDSQVFMSDWTGIFAPGPLERHGKKRSVICEKPYYALWSWNQLYRLENALATDADEHLYTAAAGKDGELFLLVSYYEDRLGYGLSTPDSEEISLTLEGALYEKATITYTDQIRTNQTFPLEDGKFTMRGNSMALIRLSGVRKA